jgi:hypothetical protein
MTKSYVFYKKKLENHIFPTFKTWQIRMLCADRVFNTSLGQRKRVSIGLELAAERCWDGHGGWELMIVETKRN